MPGDGFVFDEGEVYEENATPTPHAATEVMSFL
jgi:hypothetical protein